MAKKIIKALPKVITQCPDCGGELHPTYSSEIGFCPKCAKQWRLYQDDNHSVEG